MDLEPGEPVHDVDAGLLQPLRPRDVAVLVAARLQLDQAHGLLPGLGGGDQGGGQGRLLARAVDGRLEPAHVRVGGRAAHERLDGGGERVVRQLDERVGASQRREQRRGGRSGERPARDPDPGLVLQLGSVEPRDLRQLDQSSMPRTG